MVEKFIFRNVITGDREEIGFEIGATVRQAVENSGLIAPGSQFSVRNQDGLVVDSDPATNFVGAILNLGMVSKSYAQ